MRLLPLALWGLVLLAARQASPAPGPPSVQNGWGFRLSMLDLPAGLLDVEMTLPVAAASGKPLSLCLFMDEAGPFVKDLHLVDTPAGSQVQRDSDNSNCWVVSPSRQGGWPRKLAYRVDLKSMAAQHGEPDYAEHIDATYIWNEQAVLLHPSPLPVAAPIAIELLLPSNTPLAVPWLPVNTAPGNPSRRFQSDSNQHDHGSYVVFGKRLRELGTLSLSFGEATDVRAPPQARLYVLDLPYRASPAALRSWMGQALGAVTHFYRELLPQEIVVTLVPMGNSRSAGLYGSVLRPLRPSALIFFGGNVEAPSISDDWLATHELFHVGNPYVTERLPWLIEGFTTYYETVLRARAGALRSPQAWGELLGGFERHCQPQEGRSLAQDSQTMRRTHRYQRVYWGGACLAFVLDVAIRARASSRAASRAASRALGRASGRALGPPPTETGAGLPQSLDDLMRKLRKDSLRSPLSQDEILAALDAAAGDGLASRLLHEKRQIPVRDWLRRLGVMAGPKTNDANGPADPSTEGYPVTFDDRAPLSAIRRALF